MNKKISSYLWNIDLIIAGIMLTLLILFTFFAVVMRYVVGRPITWGEEFQLLSMVIIVFFGAGAGFRLKSHVAIDVVVDRFPPKIQRIIGIIVYILTVIILAYFFIHSASYMGQMFRTSRVTNILHIPYSLIYAAFPIGCALMILNYSVQFFGDKHKEKNL